MKFLKSIILSSILAYTSASAESPTLPPVSSIPPSVLVEGTIANDKLVFDVTSALSQHLGKEYHLEDKKFFKFVIQQPVGNKGKMQWRELWWIMDPNNGDERYIITFKETGNGTDFEVNHMNGDLNVRICDRLKGEYSCPLGS